MSAHSPLAASPIHDDTASARLPIAEGLLLRFLIQRGIVHRRLLKIIEIERSGSGTSLSLVDWLVQRGHVSEEALTAVLSVCLRLQPSDLARFALPTASANEVNEPAHVAAKPRHLRLVSSRPRPSDTPIADAPSFPDRRRKLHLPRKLRRLA